MKLQLDPRLPQLGPDYDRRLQARLYELFREYAKTFNELVDSTMEFTLADSPNVDAFGRLRVSESATIFDASQEYSSHALMFEHYTASGGSATHSTATNSTTLSTAGTTSGARAFRQSKVYWRYQHGKSQLVKMTGTMQAGSAPSGTATARIGYYDDSNGVGFGQDATGVFVFKRSDTTGSVVETKVYQTAWSVDKMNGRGPSGETLDISKSQIFVIDLQWLSVGRVRFYLQIDGQLYQVHEFVQANESVGPYMRTANLPVRWEVFNSGGVGSSISLQAICVALESEGGVEEVNGYVFTAGTKGASVSCANSSTLTPVFSMRLKDTFNSLTYRGHVHPMKLESLVSTNSAYWELVWNVSTLTSAGGATNELTGGSWSNVDATYSGVEYNTAATAYTGGIVIASGYFGTGVGISQLATATTLLSKLVLARTYGNTRDTLTLAARGIGGASSVSAAINFGEEY